MNFIMKLISKFLDQDLKNVEEENLIQKIKEQRNAWFAFFVVVFVLAIILAGCLIYVNNSHTEQVNEFITTQYINEYYPEGEEKIQFILEQVKDIDEPIKKLTAIADWEIADYTNCLEYMEWNRTEYDDPQKLGTHYLVDQDGKIRATSGEYANDPHWIAYHKMGACGELASLFEYVVNKSGYETRKVVAIYADGGNHAWVEVNVDGTWMYFDTTVYWNNYNNPEHEVKNDPWYMPVEEYPLWFVEASGVYDQRTGELVCDRYTNIRYVTPEQNTWVALVSELLNKENTRNISDIYPNIKDILNQTE